MRLTKLFHRADNAGETPGAAATQARSKGTNTTVSYTHLTLPTIYSV